MLPQRGHWCCTTCRARRLVLFIRASTSEARYRRCPLGSTTGVRRPVFAQRVTVLGSTLKRMATSRGRSMRSESGSPGITHLLGGTLPPFGGFGTPPKSLLAGDLLDLRSIVVLASLFSGWLTTIRHAASAVVLFPRR